MHLDGAGRREAHAGDHLERRGLAGAVVAEQRQGFASVHGETQVVARVDRIVRNALGEGGQQAQLVVLEQLVLLGDVIVKCHPLDDLRINNPHVFQHYPSQYDMLFVADYVISDYSTVIYEAGLLDLPVFLYAYDWPDYSKKRSLYIDPKRDIPTLFTDDAEAIVRAAYQAFIRRNVAIPEHGSCTARVVEHVFDLIAAR